MLREAAEVTPDDPLVQARLAEIELAFGDLDAAQAAAERAVALAPRLARTQMVLGFAALTRIAIADAKEAFEQAIELDSALPLARLGLGLAKIRAGDLESGARELEIAVALDPNASLLRSYLGKAYFEERRNPLDGEQYAIAKQLDPNDPTPWFYNAIRLQTINRPVEALHELERSIELNDNRAVYRSRLLLDEDLAVRQASLARIYDDLGFERVGPERGDQVAERGPGELLGAPLPGRHLCAPAAATRSRAPASCCSRSCCSRSTSTRSSRRLAIDRPQHRSRARARRTRPSTSSTRCSSATGAQITAAGLVGNEDTDRRRGGGFGHWTIR